VVERGVTRRAGAVLATRDPADLRDLLGDLGCGEQAAEPRLGALAEFDLDRADRVLLGEVHQLLDVEAPLGVPAAEVGGADLVDEVAPFWWYGLSPPSPVLCRASANAAPRLSDSTAGAESAP